MPLGDPQKFRTPFSPDPQRYDGRMAYRRSGRSGLDLPAVSLGLWQNFGSDRSLDAQTAIVRRAVDLGITHFDLADRYGPPIGAAEVALGEILRRDLRPYRDELVISSKAGYVAWSGPYGVDGSRKHVRASLDRSLTNLGLDHLDIFYSHRPSQSAPLEETMDALATAVAQGKTRYVGISSYGVEETRRAASILSRAGVPLLISQPRYSIFDRAVEFSGLLDTLGDVGAGAIVFSPLAQGLLTGRYLAGVPTDSRAATTDWIKESQLDESYLRRARGLDAIAQSRGQTLAQLAISWVLRLPGITSALVGASSPEQLAQNAAAAAAPPLTTDELSAIDEFAHQGGDRLG